MKFNAELLGIFGNPSAFDTFQFLDVVKFVTLDSIRIVNESGRVG